ncbi:hypothetical protein LWI28_003863 [Acer negundo]|uniref:Uncharacterized protein n=1 Tax=Acer negundo TaxID=4023 RepID=A0AAD5NHP7_ACENE|nr:hypothetical protein LWI28_003863 [Acer negundo]
MKDFPRASNQINDLCRDDKSRRNSFELDNSKENSLHALVKLDVSWNNANNLFQWLYDQLRKKDAKCCSSQSIKCWRHDLKDCKIDGFIPYVDVDDFDIDDLTKKLPKIPFAVLKFHLDR